MATRPSPPGPSVEAGADSLLQFNRDPLGFLTHCASEYGEIVQVDLGGRFFLLSRPNLVETVLQDKKGAFTKTADPPNLPTGNDPQSLKYAAFLSLLGDGLLTSEGEDWRARRRMLASSFQPKVTLGYTPTIVSLVERTLVEWEGKEQIDVYEQMRELTLGVVGTTLMGTDLSGQARDEGRDFKAAVEQFYHPSTDGLPFAEALVRLHRTADTILAERRAVPDSSDLLSKLLRGEGETTGLSDTDLRNELMTLLFAGHETTANAFCWTWVLLAQHPEKEARLLDEIESVLGSRSPVPDDVERLPYTQQVVNESLRLYPPVWFLGRFLQEDWEVDGYVLPTGSGVIISPWVMQRDERYFEDPEVFAPERWVGDLERRLPRGVYFPFGDGPRVCIGRPLALLELALVVATIARRFRLSLSLGQEVTPEPLNTIRPRGGLLMQLRAR